MSRPQKLFPDRLQWYVRKIREKGPRGVYRHLILRIPPWEHELVIDKYCEWKFGISTAAEITAAELGHIDPDWHDYAPSYYLSLRRILAALPLTGEDVFIDFGSGLGRCLVYGATYPMRRVIGVEYSSALNEAARDNIARAAPHIKCEIEVVRADAAQYRIPDDATIFYFGNPFKGSVLAAVLENIRASLERAPRRIYFVSHSHEEDYPFEQQVRRCPWLGLYREVKLHRGYRAWIYTNDG